MINVNDIKVAFDDIVNATQQGNYTIDAFNTMLNNAVVGLYNNRLGLTEQIDFGTAVSRISYARNKKIHNDLLPFRKRVTVAIDPLGDMFTDIPEDLYFETLVEYVTIVKVGSKAEKAIRACRCSEAAADTPKYKKYIGVIEVVQEDMFPNRANSTLITNPIYCPYSDGWRYYMHGHDIRSITITYLRRPRLAKWAYTTVNDVEVYSQALSIDVEFDSMLEQQIVDRMVKEYSQYNDDSIDANFSEGRINNGQ